jgi:hypothetical protein
MTSFALENIAQGNNSFEIIDVAHKIYRLHDEVSRSQLPAI